MKKLWKIKKKKDKRKFESLKDHNWNEILTPNWQNIELYTVWDYEGKKWKKKNI